MIETVGDIFDYLQDKDTDAICIFTNGITNKYGQAIAGAGQAGAAASRWCNFRNNLGEHLRNKGNIVGLIGKVDFFKIKSDSNEMREATMLEPYSSHHGKICIVSFPTKEHFNKPSIPELIVQSAKDLVKMSNTYSWSKVVMDRPGCGAFTGKLNYDKDVKPLIQDILDDRFLIVQK